MTRRYPLQPLLELTGWSVSGDVRRIAPCGGQEYAIRLKHGVTERVADRLAVAAGLHPHLVWPDMADHAIGDITRACEAEGCPHWFALHDGPGGHNRRFCSSSCRGRESMRRFRATDRGREANRRQSAEYRAWLRDRTAA